MKRSIKFIFLGFMAIILLVLAMNFSKIKYGLNMLSLYNKDRQTEANSDVDDDLVLVNPLENIVSNNSEEVIEEIDSSVDDENVESSSPQPKTKSYDSIINDYNSKLTNLQSEFESDLSSLLSEGFNDYSSGDISSAKLASKYISLGAKLEASSDSQFKALLKNMENELKSNNHDTYIIKELDIYYRSLKDSKKSSIISKGMSHMD